MPHASEQTPASLLVKEALESYESQLIAYAANILHGDYERARDVVQDTFVRLYLAEPDKVRQALKAWLFTVCRNRAFDVLRKDQRLDLGQEEVILSFRDESADPSRAADNNELGSLAWKLLPKLSANQQEVIRLKFLHDCSYKDIARITGLTIGNVGFLMHVGLKKLRELLTLELEPASSP
ncbi:MAG: sigma-70 family RNA polymerase sigma factor [Verrucomicrobiaceae bacterium]|nr:sigma-70 family RNA polymerase sigma factor [Verrucomicrobiaceae bacterium]